MIYRLQVFGTRYVPVRRLKRQIIAKVEGRDVAEPSGESEVA